MSILLNVIILNFNEIRIFRRLKGVAFSLLLLAILCNHCKKVESINPESASSLSYFKGGLADQMKSVVATNDGGFIYCGYTMFDSSKTDGFLMKVDRDGKQEWYKTYGGNRMDELSTVIQTTDGGYLAAGKTNSIGLGISTGTYFYYDYVLKVNANGDEEWSNSYFINPGEINGCAESPDHFYYFTGQNSQPNIWPNILNLMKLDATGNRIYIRNYTNITSYLPFNIPKYYHVYGLHVMPTSDGGVLVSGVMSKSNNYIDIAAHVTFTMKTNANGNQVSYFYPYYDDVRGGDYYYNLGLPTVKTLNLPDGYLIGTFIDGQTDGIVKTQIFKTDLNGVPLWKKEFFGLGNAFLYNIKPFDDGTILLIGASSKEKLNNAFNGGYKNLQPMLILVDKEGNKLWEQITGSAQNITTYTSIQALPDGSFSAAGKTSLSERGTDKMFWIHLDSTGKPKEKK